MKQGDTPSLRFTVRDPDGQPVDLTEAESVRLYIQHEEGDLVTNETIDVSDATDGEVSYALSEGETARLGRHDVEVVVNDSPLGETYTWPRSGYRTYDTTETLERDTELEETEAPPDADVSELRIHDRLNLQGNDIENGGTLNTEDLESKRNSKHHHWAGAHDGDSPDERLSNIQYARGDEIRLEKYKYTDDRTFNDAASLISPNHWVGAEIDGGTWIFNDSCQLQNMVIRNPDNGVGLKLENDRCSVSRCAVQGTVEVNADRCVLSHIFFNGDVVFASDTSGGEIGLVESGISITDNGNNTILTGQ